MNYNFKMIYSDYPTSHLNSLCAINAEPIEIGQGYGLGNVIMISAHNNVEIDHKNMHHIIIYYNDGMMKDMGAKALVFQNEKNQVLVLGGHGKVVFERINKGENK